jgi:hypothetical protein
MTFQGGYETYRQCNVGLTRQHSLPAHTLGTASAVGYPLLSQVAGAQALGGPRDFR